MVSLVTRDDEGELVAAEHPFLWIAALTKEADDILVDFGAICELLMFESGQDLELADLMPYIDDDTVLAYVGKLLFRCTNLAVSLPEEYGGIPKSVGQAAVIFYRLGLEWNTRTDYARRIERLHKREEGDG